MENIEIKDGKETVKKIISGYNIGCDTEEYLLTFIELLILRAERSQIEKDKALLAEAFNGRSI